MYNIQQSYHNEHTHFCREMCNVVNTRFLRPFGIIMEIMTKSPQKLYNGSFPGPRIVPSCHPGWGAVSDLGGSFAERCFKMGHRHSGTTTRAKTAPFQLSFHTLMFRCFVSIPSLCLLSASFFPLCFNTVPFNY